MAKKPIKEAQNILALASLVRKKEKEKINIIPSNAIHPSTSLNQATPLREAFRKKNDT